MKKIHKKLMEATLINKNAAECEVPEVLSYGIIAQKSPKAAFTDEVHQGYKSQKVIEESIRKDYSLMSYLIIPRFGQNLENFFESINKKLSRKSIYSLGIRIIDIIE